MITQHNSVFFCLFISLLKVCQQTESSRQKEEGEEEAQAPLIIKDDTEKGIKIEEGEFNGNEWGM